MRLKGIYADYFKNRLVLYAFSKVCRMIMKTPEKMALWIQIIGKRKVESPEGEIEFLLNVLRNLKLDLSFIGEIYNPDIWKLNNNQNIQYFEYNLDKKALFDSIRLHFNNEEFLELSGPFDIFSKYYLFIDSKNAEFTMKWREVFKKMAKAFGITHLYYFSEEFFPLDFIYNGESEVKDLCYLFNNKNRVEDLNELNNNNYFVEYCL